MDDEVDGQPEVTEPPRAANAMEVGLAGLGEVKVNDNGDSLDVNAPGQHRSGGDHTVYMYEYIIHVYDVPLYIYTF